MNKQKRINKLERAYKLTNRCTRDNTNRVRPRIGHSLFHSPFTDKSSPSDGFFFSFLFFFLSSTRATPGYNIPPRTPSLPPLYIYSMNNSCNTPRSIPPLDIAGRTGKRCRGILYKYLSERKSERDNFLTVRLSFEEEGGGDSNRSKKPRRKESYLVRNPSVSALCVPTLHTLWWGGGSSCRSSGLGNSGARKRGEGRGQKRAEKKMGTSDGRGRMTKGRENATNGRKARWTGRSGGDRERERQSRLCSLDPERTIYQSVLSIIRVYSCRPRINPAPPSLPPLLFASVKFSRSPAVVLN